MHQIGQNDEVDEPSKSKEAEGEDVQDTHPNLAKIETMCPQIAKTDTEDICQNKVSFLRCKRIPGSVDVDGWAPLRFG